MGQAIHLDSSIFIPQLYDRDTESKEYCESICADVRGAVRAHNVDVRISKLVVGEVFSRYYEDYWSESYDMRPEFQIGAANGNLTQRFEELLTELEAELVDLPDQYQRLLPELDRDGSRLGTNDMLISVTAVADPEATHFLAIDGDIWNEPSIERVARDLYDEGSRDHRLTVSQSYD